MKECEVKDCTSTELVYSGTDAFCLGVVTEKICYNCANTYAKVNLIVKPQREEHNAQNNI